MELVTDAMQSAVAEDEKKELLVNIDYKMVTFSLAEKDYAIDIMRVKEIAKAGHFTYVPNTSPFVLGVYNLRGDIIPIIDLRIFFGIPVEETKAGDVENMLILSVHDQIFGIVVDAIQKVVGISSTTIQPPHPLFGDINIKYIYGVVENADKLYILLDVDRIFGFKSEAEEEAEKRALEEEQVPVMPSIQTSLQKFAAPVSQPVSVSQSAPPPPQEKTTVVSEPDLEYSFITDSLQKLKKFTVTAVNDTWGHSRFTKWLEQRGKANAQLTSEADADEFLKDFYSQYTGRFWSKEYADAVYAALPENSAKQINVWNPGCSTGYESYCLACVLHRRYPESRIRVYAQDIDLLNVSNAPLLTIPQDVAGGWLAPYVVKNASGAFTFNQDIKDIVLFEYHDCLNATSMPSADVIFCRDLVSFLDKPAQEQLFAEFAEKLKGNGILILGDKETINGRSEFTEKMVGPIVVISKR